MTNGKPGLAALAIIAGLAGPVLAQGVGRVADPAGGFVAYPRAWGTGYGYYDSMSIAFDNYGLPGKYPYLVGNAPTADRPSGPAGKSPAAEPAPAPATGRKQAPTSAKRGGMTKAGSRPAAKPGMAEPGPAGVARPRMGP